MEDKASSANLREPVSRLDFMIDRGTVWRAVGWARLAALAMLATSALAQAQTTFTGTGTGPIPDTTGGPANWGTPLNVSFAVSGMTAPLTNVSLSITMTHTYVGDLEVILAPPGVTPGNPGSFVIFSRVGATTAGSFGDSSNLGGGAYVFNDIAASNFWTAADGVGGTTNVPLGPHRTTAAGPAAIPASATNLTAAFAGLTAAQINGTWTLRFRDGAGGDTGAVSAASLTLTSLSGPGEDGDVTISGAGVQLNRYTTLASGAAAGASTISVGL